MPSFRIQLQNVPRSANTIDIRDFFIKLHIPNGGVEIYGGKFGDAVVSFDTEANWLEALSMDSELLLGQPVYIYKADSDDRNRVHTGQNQLLSHSTNRMSFPVESYKSPTNELFSSASGRIHFPAPTDRYPDASVESYRGKSSKNMDEDRYDISNIEEPRSSAERITGLQMERSANSNLVPSKMSPGVKDRFVTSMEMATWSMEDASIKRQGTEPRLRDLRGEHMSEMSVLDQRQSEQIKNASASKAPLKGILKSTAKNVQSGLEKPIEKLAKPTIAEILAMLKRTPLPAIDDIAGIKKALDSTFSMSKPDSMEANNSQVDLNVPKHKTTLDDITHKVPEHSSVAMKSVEMPLDSGSLSTSKGSIQGHSSKIPPKTKSLLEIINSSWRKHLPAIIDDGEEFTPTIPPEEFTPVIPPEEFTPAIPPEEKCVQQVFSDTVKGLQSVMSNYDISKPESYCEKMRQTKDLAGSLTSVMSVDRTPIPIPIHSADLDLRKSKTERQELSSLLTDVETRSEDKELIPDHNQRTININKDNVSMETRQEGGSTDTDIKDEFSKWLIKMSAMKGSSTEDIKSKLFQCEVINAAFDAEMDDAAIDNVVGFQKCYDTDPMKRVTECGDEKRETATKRTEEYGHTSHIDKRMSHEHRKSNAPSEMEHNDDWLNEVKLFDASKKPNLPSQHFKQRETSKALFEDDVDLRQSRHIITKPPVTHGINPTFQHSHGFTKHIFAEDVDLRSTDVDLRKIKSKVPLRKTMFNFTGDIDLRVKSGAISEPIFKNQHYVPVIDEDKCISDLRESAVQDIRRGEAKRRVESPDDILKTDVEIQHDCLKDSSSEKVTVTKHVIPCTSMVTDKYLPVKTTTPHLHDAEFKKGLLKHQMKKIKPNEMDREQDDNFSLDVDLRGVRDAGVPMPSSDDVYKTIINNIMERPSISDKIDSREMHNIIGSQFSRVHRIKNDSHRPKGQLYSADVDLRVMKTSVASELSFTDATYREPSLIMSDEISPKMDSTFSDDVDLRHTNQTKIVDKVTMQSSIGKSFLDMLPKSMSTIADVAQMHTDGRSTESLLLSKNPHVKAALTTEVDTNVHQKDSFYGTGKWKPVDAKLTATFSPVEPSSMSSGLKSPITPPISSIKDTSLQPDKASSHLGNLKSGAKRKMNPQFTATISNVSDISLPEGEPNSALNNSVIGTKQRRISLQGATTSRDNSLPRHEPSQIYSIKDISLPPGEPHPAATK